ncbi:MAG: hypothetical protein ACRERE_06610 [Candidatus Entotheonellia bacterium]
MLEVEGYVERTQNAFAVRAWLDLMRDEKAYLLQNDARYSRAIYEDLKELKRMVLAQNAPASPVIRKTLEDYETAFTKFVLLEQTIGITDDVGLQGELQRSSQAMGAHPPEHPSAGYSIRLFRGKGCAQCHGSGFRGRLGVFELFEISDHIRSMIMERQDTSAIRAEAITRGMKTMFQDGIAKAFFGETTLEEVFRVAV